MSIELGIATPAVPRDPRALDDRFGKWAADLGITVIGTHLGPTPEDVAPHAAELRERLAGWGLRVVQATGFNPVMVGDDEARRADDLERLTRAFEVARLLGSPMVLSGCGSYHPTHHYGPHPRNHTQEARERIVQFLRPAARRAEEHGVLLVLECHLLTALDTPAHIREVVDGVGSSSVRVNFDPVNLLSSVDAVFASGAEMARMQAELGPRYHCTRRTC
jgi:sugar phosphate isomerase/epimerase